jgi:tetrahydromethanopterin S-methyltransferase subunit G
LPSDDIKNLLNRLETLNQRVQTALGENDADLLGRLLTRTRAVLMVICRALKPWA